MPIGAVMGASAVVGAGSSMLAASSQKKASKRAAGVAQKTADENNALTRDIYDQNVGILAPYVQRGNAAGNAFNELMGLAPQATQPMQSAPMGQNAMMAMADPMGGGGQYDGMARRQIERPDEYVGGYGEPVLPQSPLTQAMPQQAPAARSAFDQYLGSTGYQFRVDEGNKAINQGYAARGQLESGAAMKALQERGQNISTDYFKDYLGLLGNQQGVGLGAGSALAGVGQQYAGTRLRAATKRRADWRQLRGCSAPAERA